MLPTSLFRRGQEHWEFKENQGSSRRNREGRGALLEALRSFQVNDYFYLVLRME